MKIGYCKIGRSMPLSLDKCGSLGGDVEAAAVIKSLALRNPADEFILIGRNSGETAHEVGLPDNVINPWTNWRSELLRRREHAGLKHGDLTKEDQFALLDVFRDLTGDTFSSLDAIIVWDGQHGTTNIPLPGIKDQSVLTKPQDWSALYCGWLLDGVNSWRDVDPLQREEIHLNADVRNRLKMRDLKWPLLHPVLTQYDFVSRIKHHRWGAHDTPSGPWLAAGAQEIASDTWQSKITNAYSRLEVNALLPNTPFGSLISYDDNWVGRRHFGVMVNETRAYVSEQTSRKTALRDWVLPLDPAFIHGTWSKASLQELGVNITPASWDMYYPLLHSVRCTFTMPSSGSGWATVKPWEAFAGGTVCFFHPRYDDQDHILRDAHPNLREFLRVDSPKVLARRVAALSTEPESWHWVVRAQREHFENAMSELRYLQMIEDRLRKGNAS